MNDSSNPAAKTVSGSVSSLKQLGPISPARPNPRGTRFEWEEQRYQRVGWGWGWGDSVEAEDPRSVRPEAGGVAGLVPDAQTYADVIGAESSL